jgi:phenylpyruvate tautomerase PptA (4-oxalocrotonate tautomerase family)
MPSVLIEVRKTYSREQEAGLIEAVHAALCEGFKIPAGDKNVRLVVHEAHRFVGPPGKAKPEAFTHVTVEAFAGRSLDAKRALYRAIVTNLEPFGIPRDQVMISLRELPPENWGIRGGQAACDVELGFKVDV